jgi:hypothetical protein
MVCDKFCSDLTASIARAIINDNHFKVRKRLPRKAPQRFRNGFRCVV